MTLLVAIGNSLRGDDAAAHAVLDRIPASGKHTARTVHQLTPELAAEMARFATVVFLDADAEANTLTIERLDTAAKPRSPLSHGATPEEIVALSAALFGFGGRALLCRIPARRFDAGDAPAPEVLRFLEEAAIEIAGLL